MPQIESAEEAKSVARLIQSGQITGSARDGAMEALRAFDAGHTAGASAQAPVTGTDRGLAVASGASSMLASIAGLPMDTAMNIADLGKALLGVTYGHFTGKAPPSALQVGDRADVPMTGDWLRNDRLPNGQLQLREPYRLAHPEDPVSRYASAAGAAIPATMLGQPATAAEAGMGLLSNLSSNVAGQGASDLGHAMNLDPTSQTLLGASGQILGGVAPGAVAARIAQPLRPNLTPEQQAGLQETTATADANNIPMDAAQRTGSTFMQRMKNMTADNPFTAGGQHEFVATQKTAINRAILNTIGEDAPRATPEVMGNARTRIGQVMDTVAARNPIPLDRALTTELQAAQDQLVRTVPASDHGPILANIEDITTAAAQNNGVIPGAVYQKLRSNLGQLSSDPRTGPVATDLREALDDALTRTARNPDDVAALTIARQQYRNMKNIEGAISKENNYNISPALVTNALGTKRMGNRNTSVYGRGDQTLAEVARAGRVLMDQGPNSGTPSRLASLGSPALLGAAGLSALHGNLLPAAGLATAGYGFPRLMQGINNSPGMAQYLAEGIAPGNFRGALEYPRMQGFLAASALNATLNEDQQRLRGLLSPGGQ